MGRERGRGRPDVAIDHDWWAGLNIDEDSDDDPDHNPERFEAYYVDPKTEDYGIEARRGGGVVRQRVFALGEDAGARGRGGLGLPGLATKTTATERTRASRKLVTPFT